MKISIAKCHNITHVYYHSQTMFNICEILLQYYCPSVIVGLQSALFTVGGHYSMEGTIWSKGTIILVNNVQGIFYSLSHQY